MLAVARLRVARWDRALARLEDSQMAQLHPILRHAKGTEFGRDHGFAGIERYEDWVRRVPLRTYDDFHPSIERMMRGERNILVPEFVRHYGNSSGSSNKGRSKFLPITDRQLKQQLRGAPDALYRHLIRSKDVDFPTGFTLGLFPPTTMKEQGPVRVTSNPALMFANLPPTARPVYLPRGSLKEESDYDKKLKAIADAYFDHDVRAVSGTTCWFSLLFDRLLEVAQERGRKADHVWDIWPNLRLLLGGGVSAAPYMSVLAERLGGEDFTLVDTYNATEGGIYACSDHSGAKGMLMIPDQGVFFEFVPVDGRGPDAPRVPLWAVRPGVPYSIVVTTSSGLYAYELGDIVRFSTVFPHRIEFMGRLAGCLSTTQELTTHVEIEQALSEALRTHPLTTVDFGAGADVGVGGTGKSRYVLFVEPEEGQALPPEGDFARAFDDGLQTANRVYREHRTKDAAILAPEIHFLPPGTVKRFMSESGRTSVQTKFPRILDDESKDMLRGMLNRV
jgi:hypothetical protein